MWRVVASTAALALVASAVSAAKSQQSPAGTARIAEGRTLFVSYCATCHGTSGHGDGPVGEDLRVRPADLTQLANRNGGRFVPARIQRIIDGRDMDVKEHGNIEMPVWGNAFKRREGLSEEAVRARIEAIVRYLESIQERSS
jgi:mono/diheme cytochrome c family protein